MSQRLRRDFGLVIRFVNNLQAVTTIKYNSVACFANAGTVEARSIESSTQQKEN
jgi:hypothetical protein